MHSNNFVIAIKHAGRVLREHADLVTLPFGAEYSVYFKNLNSLRAQVTVSIDGKDATEGCRLILPPNDSIELERFIKGGNIHSGNKLKFIERTSAVEQHRGVGAEDGMVRVEFWRERVVPPLVVSSYYDIWHPQQPPYSPHFNNTTYGNGCRSTLTRSSGFRSFDSVGSASEPFHSASCNFMQSSLSNTAASAVGQNLASVNDAGITVGGSHSSQAFTSMLGFPLESTSTVLTLRLRGEIGGQPVSRPILINHNVSCPACGLSSRSSAQFCSRCGAGLTSY